MDGGAVGPSLLAGCWTSGPGEPPEVWLTAAGVGLAHRERVGGGQGALPLVALGLARQERVGGGQGALPLAAVAGKLPCT